MVLEHIVSCRSTASYTGIMTTAQPVVIHEAIGAGPGDDARSNRSSALKAWQR